MSHHLPLALFNSVCVLYSMTLWLLIIYFEACHFSQLQLNYWINFVLEIILLNWKKHFCVVFVLAFLCSHSQFLICACSFDTLLPWVMWTYLEQLVWSISQFDETSGPTQRISLTTFPCNHVSFPCFFLCFVVALAFEIWVC